MQTAAAMRHRLVLQILQDGRTVGWEVLDMERELSPLCKELAYRAVTAHPQFRGAEWGIHAALECSGKQQCLRAEARLRDGRRPQALATVRIPLPHLYWIAERMAGTLKLQGQYTFCVTVLEDGSEVAKLWEEVDANADFEVTEVETQLRLPSAFSSDLPGPRQSLRRAGTWLTCVFPAPVLEAFLAAAEQQEDVEHAWAAPTRVCLTPAGCWVVIGKLVEAPAVQRGHAYILSTGGQTFDLFAACGGSAGAYLHTHPPTMQGEDGKPLALSAAPSPNDSVVAWNLCASTPAPIVLPIALSGRAAPANGAPRLAAFGYEKGILREINLEVLT